MAAAISALADALDADDRRAVAAHAAAAVDILDRYRAASGATVDAPIGPDARPQPFKNATTIAALLEELKLVQPAAGAGSVDAPAADHSTRTNPPTQGDWDLHAASMELLCQHAASLHAKNTQDRNALAPPTPTLSDADVAYALTCWHGSMPSCQFGASCIATTLLTNGELMRRYYSPAEWQHWTITGTLTEPMKARAPCYLCQLMIGNVMLTAAPRLNAERIELPFCHYVDAPGGYKRSAMHPSATASAVSHGVTALLRAINVAEYRATETEIYEPRTHDPATGLATEWGPVQVACLVESAAVAFGTDASVAAAAPSQFLAPKLRAAPSCERLLGDEYVPADALARVDFSALLGLSAQAAAHAKGVVSLEHAFGCARPAAVSLLQTTTTDADTARRALAFCSLGEARARLFAVILAGAPSCTRLLSLRCLPSAFPAGSTRLLDCAAAGVPETPASVLRHSVLFLVLLRLNVIATMEPTHRLKTYAAALQPLYGHLAAGIQRGDAADAALFRLDPAGAALIPYAEFYPRPAPAYFEASDIAAVGAAPTELRKVDMPAFGREYLFSCLRPAAQARGAPRVPDSLFAAAWQNATAVCGPAMLPAIEWMAQRSDRAGMQTPFATDTSATGKCLRNALPIGARNTLVWATITLRFAMLYAALEALPADAVATPCAHIVQAVLAAYDAGARVVAVRDVCARAGARAQADENATAANAVLADRRRLGARDYVKRLLYAHMALCADLLDCGAVFDDECEQIVVQRYQALPLHDGLFAVPLACAPAACLANALAEPGWELDEPVGVAALRDALPGPMLRTVELQRALAAARADHGDFLALSALAVHAALGGYLPGAPAAPPAEQLVTLYRQLVAGTDAQRRAALERMAPDLDAVCMRRYVSALMDCCPELAVQAALRYTGVGEWRAQLGEALKDVHRLDDGSPPESMRVVARPSAHDFCDVLLDAVTGALGQIFESGECDALVPPRATVDAIEAYVAELPRSVPFDAEWLRRAGLHRDSIKAVQRLYDNARSSEWSQMAAAAQAALWEICTVHPLDGALCYCFALLRQQYQARGFVRLDRELAVRQLYAVNRARLYPAYVTRALCCNRICNFTAQYGPDYSGLSGVETCVADGTARGAVRRCISRAARGTSARAAGAVRVKLPAALAERYKMPCGAPVEAVLTIGVALEHLRPVMRVGCMTCEQCGPQSGCVPHDSKDAKQCKQCSEPLAPAQLRITPTGLVCTLCSAPVTHRAGAPLGCTACPRCGANTGLAPARIGPCGLTCGLCDEAERAAAAKASAPAALRCCICGNLRAEALRLARRMNVMACVTPVRVLDDCTIDGAVAARDALLCSMCYKPWILPALQQGLCVSQIRDALQHNANEKIGWDELMDPPCDQRFRAEATAFLADARETPPAFDADSLSFSRSLVARIVEPENHAVQLANSIRRTEAVRRRRREQDRVRPAGE